MFVHVPKTAGTAVRRALGLSHVSHHTLREYRDLLGFARFEAYRKIAFVRHPFHRFVSLYNYARMDVSDFHNNTHPERARHGRHLDHERVKAGDINACVRRLIAGQLVHVPSHVMWWPQTTWVTIDGRVRLDFMGKQENMAADLAGLGAFLGRDELVVGRENRSIAHARVEDLSEASLDLLRLYYASDFELLGYDPHTF